MKILILQVYNTYNYGTAMMGINIAHYISKINIDKNIEIYVDCITEDNIRRFKDSMEIDNVKMNDIFIRKNKTVSKSIRLLTSPIRYINFKKNKKMYIKELSEKYDKIIILGGDDMSGEYPFKGIRNQLINIRDMAKLNDVILFGHTIGPFNKYRSFIAKRCLKNTKIYTRDANSYSYLKDTLGLVYTEQTADLAFLDLPNQRSIDGCDLLEKYNLIKDNYVTLVPSGLYKYYTDDEEAYVTNWIEIIGEIAKMDELKSSKILLLAHVLQPSSVDDNNIISKIKSRLDKKLNDRLVVIDKAILPVEARIILGNGIITVTGRMHAAVSTLQMGKPALSLSYSVKYEGVISKGLSLPKLVIDTALNIDDDKWKKREVALLVKERAEYILKDYEFLVREINENVGKCKNTVYSNLKRLLNSK